MLAGQPYAVRAVAVFVVGLLVGCGPQDHLLLTNTDDPLVRAGSVAIFRAAYAAVADRYIEPLPITTIAERGMAGLTALDPAIRVEHRDAQLILNNGSRRLGTLPAPAATDPDGWAAATVALWQAAHLHSSTIGEATPETVYAAIFGAIAGSLDRYSGYATAAEAKRARERREGHLGYGLEVDRDHDGPMRVSAVTPGGPAERAGVRTGDVISRIDGMAAVDLGHAGLTLHLKEKRGDPLWLAVERPRQPQRQFRLQRMPIVPDTVSETIADGIAIVRISQFNQGTVGLLTARLATLVSSSSEPIHGVILDLRGNAGGLLQSAVKAADLFLTPGPIAETHGRHPESRQVFRAVGGDSIHGLPLVVLVDGRTASAAEVLAAALKDRGRAVVVGRTTYGKGWVQTVVPLPNQGELSFTWARLVAPVSGDLAQGVVPSVCLATDDDAEAAADALAASDPETPSLPCPRHRADGPAAVVVARALLADPVLYARALTPADQLAAAHR